MTSNPGNEVQVRQATIVHLDAIVDFNAAMARETEGKILDIDLLRPGVEAVLTRNDRGFYLIAEHSGRPAGSLLITYEWSDWRNAFFWWIQSVYVSPEFRRNGVYKAMHLYAALEGRRHDICGLRLYVDKDNEIAQRVYSSLNMRPTNYDMYEIEFNTRRDLKE